MTCPSAKRDQAMVGDGDAVGIAAEILQNILGSAEGWFGVDDPIFAEERTQPGSEELGMGEQVRVLRPGAVDGVEGNFRPATNLPRNTRRSTGDGKEEAWRDRIQRA